ncbi:NADPH-dependent FMN reductase [Methylocella sp.]|uniref:NADPH-dependent FMN reductase n=1 Tax=Methylocella sp. TaxID=1978226 RepID=UPI003C1CF8EE
MIEKASSVSGWRTILLIGTRLRANSVDAAVLKTVQTLIPTNAKAAIYTGLADLPHFNPDDDRDRLPEPVARLLDQLRAADAVLFSTPEYAGTLPGSFKNLLDWTVGGGSLYRLPVGWVNPSAHGGSQGTYQVLRTVLNMAGAKIVESACIDVPISRDAVGADGVIADSDVRKALGRAAKALVDCVFENKFAVPDHAGPTRA